MFSTNCVLFNEFLKKDITETYIILSFEKYTEVTQQQDSPSSFTALTYLPRKGKLLQMLDRCSH